MQSKPCSVFRMVQTSTLKHSAPESLKAFIQSGALKHIAIIMDGNRRWAKRHFMPGPQGHYQGYQTLKTIIEYCSLELGLPALTVYAFSTENWQRPGEEVGFLLKLFHQTLQKEIEELSRKNVQLKFLGNLQEFSPEFQAECRKSEAMTAHNTGMLFQVALNYGGRSEIVQSCKKIAEAVQTGQLRPEEITENHIAEHLYTQNTFDPDMVIRTGGEYRLSNFLLWQSAYAEICIVDELWPEFTPEVLNRTIENFQHRHRRFGK